MRFVRAVPWPGPVLSFVNASLEFRIQHFRLGCVFPESSAETQGIASELLGRSALGPEKRRFFGVA